MSRVSISGNGKSARDSENGNGTPATDAAVKAERQAGQDKNGKAVEVGCIVREDGTAQTGLVVFVRGDGVVYRVLAEDGAEVFTGSDSYNLRVIATADSLAGGDDQDDWPLVDGTRTPPVVASLVATAIDLTQCAVVVGCIADDDVECDLDAGMQDKTQSLIRGAADAVWGLARHASGRYSGYRLPH